MSTETSRFDFRVVRLKMADASEQIAPPRMPTDMAVVRLTARDLAAIMRAISLAEAVCDFNQAISAD